MTTELPPSAYAPLELRAPEGAQQMEIDWEDGQTSVLPHRFLRGFCPCAGCQGHSGPIAFMDGGDRELRDIDEVGQYALKLVWGDGHNTGIYSFRFLRTLGDACSSENITSRTFQR